MLGPTFNNGRKVSVVMLQTNFSYKKDKDGFYREVLADGSLSNKRFKKLENLAEEVASYFSF